LKIIILRSFKAVLFHVMNLFQNLWKPMELISREIVCLCLRWIAILLTPSLPGCKIVSSWRFLYFSGQTCHKGSLLVSWEYVLSFPLPHVRSL